MARLARNGMRQRMRVPTYESRFFVRTSSASSLRNGNLGEKCWQNTNTREQRSLRHKSSLLVAQRQHAVVVDAGAEGHLYGVADG